MTIKSALIRILEENRGKAVSGERLAKELQVSRAAVWKAVQALRASGYAITSGKNRGYTLEQDDDSISAEGIRYYLPERYQALPVEVLPVIDSTNAYAKRQVTLGCNADAHAEIIAANEQTAGRGRLGRSFFSPADTGIYMTLVLRTSCRTEDFLPITIAAAIAVCRVIERFSSEKPQIKWVNDVWLGSKKVCGILTEGISGFENGRLEAAIVGIGINVATKDSSFPEGVRGTAASLSEVCCSRNQMIAAAAAELLDLSEKLSDPALMCEYRARSLVLGKEIYWDAEGRRHYGRAAEINDAGNLEVDTEEGRVVLNSGEVSIRPLTSESGSEG